MADGRRAGREFLEELREDRCVRVLYLPSSEHEGDGGRLRLLGKLLQRLRVLKELRPVPIPEFGEPLGFVAKPPAQLSAWSKLLPPCAEG